MSIKIDLLPAYVNLRRWFKRLLVGFASLLTCVGMVLYVLFYKDKLQLDAVQSNLDGVQANKTEAIKVEGETKKIVDDSAPMTTQVKFYSDACRTGAERAALIDLAIRYIYNDAYVDDINFSGNIMTVSAHVKSVEDSQNLLLKMRNGSLTNGGALFAADAVSGSVKVSEGAVGGYNSSSPPTPAGLPIPTEEPQILTYPFAVKLTATLQNGQSMPTEPGQAAAAVAGAAGAAAGAVAGAVTGTGTAPATPATPTTP